MKHPFSSQKGMMVEKIVPITWSSLTAFLSMEWMKDWRVTNNLYWKEKDIQSRVVGVATGRRMEAAGV
jgi:hypothetical protein